MKKMIAPIVITVIIVLYYILYFGLIMSLIEYAVIKVLLGIIPIILSGVMIFVCIQRINEIRSGEENDLGKY